MPAPNWTTVTAAALAATMGVGGFMLIEDGATSSPVEEIRLTEVGDGVDGLDDATRRLVEAAEQQPSELRVETRSSKPTVIGTIPPPAIPVRRPVASAAPPPAPVDSGGTGGSTAEQPAPAPAPAEDPGSVDSPADPPPPPESLESDDSVEPSSPESGSVDREG